MGAEYGEAVINRDVSWRVTAGRIWSRCVDGGDGLARLKLGHLAE
jgi:hypothetical protein